MTEGNISQEFRLKNIDDTRNYFLKEIKQNKLMSRKYRKLCTTLNYIENFSFSFYNYWMCLNFLLLLILLGISIGVTSSAIGLNIFAIAAGIEKYKSLIKKKKTKHDKIALYQ